MSKSMFESSVFFRLKYHLKSCLNKCFKPQLDQNCCLTFFTLQFQLICAELSSRGIDGNFSDGGVAEKISQILSNSLLVRTAVGEYLEGFFLVLFVCLKHILLLGSESLSSAVADDRCHPAVLLCQQWLSGTPKAKFPVSVLKKKKLNMNSLCSVSRVVLEIFCSGGSYLRTIQTQAFP